MRLLIKYDISSIKDNLDTLKRDLNDNRKELIKIRTNINKINDIFIIYKIIYERYIIYKNCLLKQFKINKELKVIEENNYFLLISESTNRQKWDSINYLINSNETIKNMIQIEDTSNLLIEALNIYNINSLLTNQIDNIENLLFQLYFIFIRIIEKAGKILIKYNLTKIWQK